MELLITHGTRIHTLRHGGFPPLYVAMQNVHLGVVQRLLEHGASLVTTYNNNFTPVYAVAAHGPAKVVWVLAELGASMETPITNRVTHTARSSRIPRPPGSHQYPLPLRRFCKRASSRANDRRLRGGVRSWASYVLARHRDFQDTFLLGCLRERTPLGATFGGVRDLRVRIALYVGIVTGVELWSGWAVRAAIAGINWEAHNEVSTPLVATNN